MHNTRALTIHHRPDGRSLGCTEGDDSTVTLQLQASMDHRRDEQHDVVAIETG